MSARGPRPKPRGFGEQPSDRRRRETDGSSYVPMICRAMGGRSNGPSSPNFDEEGEIFRAPDFFNLGVTNNPIHGDDLEIWNVCGFSEDEGDGFDDHDEEEDYSDADAWWEQLEYIYVITFQEPGSTTAGFYANRAEAENGEPVDIIVGFAGLDDAIRHCGLLQANIEHGCLPEAYVEAIAPETLVEICEEKFCHCSIQRSGSLLLPPEQIVVEEDVESARARFQRMFDGM
eukprot:CAMPEP_0114261098 /NCGR_PEP_ID=MMETSP0058-20121206/20909_1 /TAXON_ID=36894 /ORGANISM="Pyramimonas parkeae, CCMP726" /LENGTH=230 /DNA_ID=CAMNT_0001376517 /DNA_START=222 /DNA_END=914 /DNA_ORIENTATION=-